MGVLVVHGTFSATACELCIATAGGTNMKKTLLTGVAVLFLATGAAHAEQSLLPSGFLGDWCMSKNSDGDIAHRKEVVGPCKKTLSIGGKGFRNNGDYCKYDDAVRNMVHTQLIHYMCKNGKSGVVQITIDRTGKTGLETLYIDYMNEDYWKKETMCLRESVC
jgi:hypothetical protein